MPRVTHVNKARKDNPVCKAGESYYWWKFPYGPRRYSLTMPKRSMLTQSGFLSQMWDIEDDMIGKIEVSDLSELESVVDSIREEVENLRYEAEESLDNLPEQLQEGHMLTERVEEVGAMVSELDCIDLGVDGKPDDTTDADWLAQKIEEVQAISYNGG